MVEWEASFNLCSERQTAYLIEHSKLRIGLTARSRIARQLANRKKARRRGILRLPAQIITELFMSVGARSSAAVCAS